MGCLVFIFDMLGYADSQQIFLRVTPIAMPAQPAYARWENGGGTGRWGFSTTVQAESRCNRSWGLPNLETRSNDQISSNKLPDVDPERLRRGPVNSGGGTQTHPARCDR